MLVEIIIYFLEELLVIMLIFGLSFISLLLVVVATTRVVDTSP